jgi:DNA polymerase III epsilon subunit family exonuclease
MIKVRNGMLWDEFSTLVDPLMPIPYDITALTGIDDEMVAHAPTAQEVAGPISQFLGDGVFTAHNAHFDLGFVNSTLAKGKLQAIQNPVLCTCKLARRLLPNLQSKSLGPVTKQLGISNLQRHRAAGDAYATAQVLIRFLDRLEEEFEVTDVRGLMRFQ